MCVPKPPDISKTAGLQHRYGITVELVAKDCEELLLAGRLLENVPLVPENGVPPPVVPDPGKLLPDVPAVPPLPSPDPLEPGPAEEFPWPLLIGLLDEEFPLEIWLLPAPLGSDPDPVEELPLTTDEPPPVLVIGSLAEVLSLDEKPAVDEVPPPLEFPETEPLGDSLLLIEVDATPEAPDDIALEVTCDDVAAEDVIADDVTSDVVTSDDVAALDVSAGELESDVADAFEPPSPDNGVTEIGPPPPLMPLTSGCRGIGKRSSCGGSGQ